MRVMLLHKLAEGIPEDYVPPQKLIADVAKMVSDARDGGSSGMARSSGRWVQWRRVRTRPVR